MVIISEIKKRIEEYVEDLIRLKKILDKCLENNKIYSEYLYTEAISEAYNKFKTKSMINKKSDLYIYINKTFGKCSNYIITESFSDNSLITNYYDMKKYNAYIQTINRLNKYILGLKKTIKIIDSTPELLKSNRRKKLTANFWTALSTGIMSIIKIIELIF